jgi:hypothetical protein
MRARQRQSPHKFPSQTTNRTIAATPAVFFYRDSLPNYPFSKLDGHFRAAGLGFLALS